MADPKQRPALRSADDASLRALGIYLLPNLFTSAALFAGFYVIVQAKNSNVGDYCHDGLFGRPSDVGYQAQFGRKRLR